MALKPLFYLIASNVWELILLLHYFFPITPTWTRSIPACQCFVIIVVSFFVLNKKVVENQTWRSVISHTQKHGLKNKYIHVCKKLPDITSLASCMLLDIVETLFFSVKDSLRSCKHYLDENNIWTVNNNIYYFFQLVHWTLPVVNWEQTCWTFVWS